MITVEEYRDPAVVDPSGKYLQPEGRGPGGRPFCRWCHQEVGKHRRAWCGEECIESYLLAMGINWNFTREYVFSRDGGLCTSCGCDLKRLKRIIDWARKSDWDFCPGTPRGRTIRWTLQPLGFHDAYRSLWDVDHILARKDGGDNTPDNLRTLCVPCHKGRTAAQHGQWAADRRDADAELFAGTAAQEVTP